MTNHAARQIVAREWEAQPRRTIPQIAQTARVSEKTVLLIREELGLPRRRRGAAEGRPASLNQDQIDMIETMWLADAPMMEIAESVGVALSTVEKWRAKLGLPARDASTTYRIEQARVRPPRCEQCQIRLDCAAGCPRAGCEHYCTAAQFGERPDVTLAGVSEPAF